jgi:hypothetical protein
VLAACRGHSDRLPLSAVTANHEHVRPPQLLSIRAGCRRYHARPQSRAASARQQPGKSS